jgi:hypothetical protein
VGSVSSDVDDVDVDDVDDTAERQAECAMRRLILLGQCVPIEVVTCRIPKSSYQFISVTILFFTIRYNCYELSI